tara:strand:- start:919 stop:1176 length:258 start_codon:yes stop_codon:yes gene_type:complete
MSKDWWDDLPNHPANGTDDTTKYPILLKDLDDIVVDGIDTADYPDFCDAYISSAVLYGKECTDEQLDEINENYDFVQECVENQLY